MKSISTFVIAFLIIGFMFLALPEKGYSQDGITGCCQLFAPDGPDDCFDTNDILECEAKKGEFIPGGVCSTNGIECIGPQVSPIPTLSQWGLITMAGILGVIGFIMVIRRKKASA